MPFQDLVLLIFSFTALQGFLLSALLKVKYREQEANYLAAICAVFSAMMVFYVAFWSQAKIPQYLVWIQYMTFLAGPLFYMLSAGIPFAAAFKGRSLLHFSVFPLVIALAYSRVQPIFILLAQPLHLVVYAVLTALVCRNRKMQAVWPALSLGGYAALFCLYTVMVLSQTLTREFDYLISAAMCVFIYSLMIASYLKPRLFEQLKATYGLSPAFSEAVMSRVLDHFEQSKPYLNGEYRLSDLSSQLAVKPYQLSEVINRHYNGFQQLLTDYRIEESKKLLTSTSTPIIDVAFMSGFNNKVSFYKSFRKITGMTPAEWRDKAKAVNIYMN